MRAIAALLAFASLSCAAPAPPSVALPGPPWEVTFDEEGLLVLGEPALSPEGELLEDQSQSPLWRFDLSLAPLPLRASDALRRGATCLSDGGATVIRHLSAKGDAIEVLLLEGDATRETRRLSEAAGRMDCPTVLEDGSLLYAASLPSGTELKRLRAGEREPETLLRSKYQWSTGWRHVGAASPAGGAALIAWDEEGERVLVLLPPEGVIKTYRLGFQAASCAAAPVCGEEAIAGLAGGSVVVATVSPEGEVPALLLLSPSGEQRWVRLSETRLRTPLGLAPLPGAKKVAVAWLEEGMPGRLRVALVSLEGEILARAEATAFSPMPLAPMVRATEEEIQVAFPSARGLGSFQLQLFRLDHQLGQKDQSGLLTTALALLPVWGWLVVLGALVSLLLGWLWGRRLRWISALFARARPTPPGPHLSGMAAVRGLCLPEGEALPLERSGDRLRPGAPFFLEGPEGKLRIDPTEALLFSLPGGEAWRGAIPRGTEMVALGHVCSPRSATGVSGAEPTRKTPQQGVPEHALEEVSQRGELTLTGPCFLIEGEIHPVAEALAKSARDRLWAGILAGAFFLSIAIIRGLLSIAGG